MDMLESVLSIFHRVQKQLKEQTRFFNEPLPSDNHITSSSYKDTDNITSGITNKKQQNNTTSGIQSQEDHTDDDEKLPSFYLLLLLLKGNVECQQCFIDHVNADGAETKMIDAFGHLLKSYSASLDSETGIRFLNNLPYIAYFCSQSQQFKGSSFVKNHLLPLVLRMIELTSSEIINKTAENIVNCFMEIYNEINGGELSNSTNNPQLTSKFIDGLLNIIQSSMECSISVCICILPKIKSSISSEQFTVLMKILTQPNRELIWLCSLQWLLDMPTQKTNQVLNVIAMVAHDASVLTQLASEEPLESQITQSTKNTKNNDNQKINKPILINAALCSIRYVVQKINFEPVIKQSLWLILFDIAHGIACINSTDSKDLFSINNQDISEGIIQEIIAGLTQPQQQSQSKTQTPLILNIPLPFCELYKQFANRPQAQYFILTPSSTKAFIHVVKLLFIKPTSIHQKNDENSEDQILSAFDFLRETQNKSDKTIRNRLDLAFSATQIVPVISANKAREHLLGFLIDSLHGEEPKEGNTNKQQEKTLLDQLVEDNEQSAYVAANTPQKIDSKTSQSSSFFSHSLTLSSSQKSLTKSNCSQSNYSSSLHSLMQLLTNNQPIPNYFYHQLLSTDIINTVSSILQCIVSLLQHPEELNGLFESLIIWSKRSNLQWRRRSLLALVLPGFIQHIPCIHRQLVNEFFELVIDNVCAVRDNVAEFTGLLFQRLPSRTIHTNHLYSSLLAHIRGIGHSESAVHRRMFILMCESISQYTPKIFLSYFKEEFMRMVVEDRAISVRITAGKMLLKESVLRKGCILDIDVKRMIRQMQRNEKQKDVRDVFKQIYITEEELLSQDGDEDDNDEEEEERKAKQQGKDNQEEEDMQEWAQNVQETQKNTKEEQDDSQEGTGQSDAVWLDLLGLDDDLDGNNTLKMNTNNGIGIEFAENEFGEYQSHCSQEGVTGDNIDIDNGGDVLGYHQGMMMNSTGIGLRDEELGEYPTKPNDSDDTIKVIKSTPTLNTVEQVTGEGGTPRETTTRQHIKTPIDMLEDDEEPGIVPFISNNTMRDSTQQSTLQQKIDAFLMKKKIDHTNSINSTKDSTQSEGQFQKQPQSVINQNAADSESVRSNTGQSQPSRVLQENGSQQQNKTSLMNVTANPLLKNSNTPNQPNLAGSNIKPSIGSVVQQLINEQETNRISKSEGNRNATTKESTITQGYQQQQHKESMQQQQQQQKNQFQQSEQVTPSHSLASNLIQKDQLKTSPLASIQIAPKIISQTVDVLQQQSTQIKPQTKQQINNRNSITESNITKQPLPSLVPSQGSPNLISSDKKMQSEQKSQSQQQQFQELSIPTKTATKVEKKQIDDAIPINSPQQSELLAEQKVPKHQDNLEQKNSI